MRGEMVTPMSEERLSIIDRKLDRLAEAVVSLARMEERMLGFIRRMDKADETQEETETRLHELESSASRRGVVYRLTDKAVWLMLGSVIAGLVSRVI